MLDPDSGASVAPRRWIDTGRGGQKKEAYDG
jgi:hypothetical protein